jgi:GNAT superfamily N-acetyltransferase
MSESQSIRLDLVKVKDLHAFACDFFAKPDGQVTSPTTIPRALAQSKNPYADADDIGLVIAYAGKQCVGYGGILPGVLKSARGITKIYWPSSIYVLPEWRRRQVAQKIVER